MDTHTASRYNMYEHREKHIAVLQATGNAREMQLPQLPGSLDNTAEQAHNKDVASNSSCRCVHVHMLNADVGQRDFNASSLYVNARVIDHDNILLRYSSIHCKMR